MFLLRRIPTYILITISLTIKLGLFPFISWVPLVISNISWFSCFFVRTFQKLNPIIVLLSLKNNNMFLMLATLSIFFSGFYASNQTNLRRIIAYSSISHSSFIIICGLISTSLILMYILIYTYLTGFLFYNFYKKNIFSNTTWKTNSKKNINIIVLTFAGLPPFPIFFIKITVFYYLAFISPMYLIFIIIGSLISMYFYFLLVLPTLLK